MRPDYTITCWGYLKQVSLPGNGAPAGAFRALTAAPPGVFTSIAAGEIFTCGIREDGTLACWGDDTYGVATPPPGNFKTLATRRSFACALRLDGS